MILTVKNIATPDLGGATDVTVIEVLVKQGDKVAVDTPIVTLESDKATMEIPTTEAGVVKEIKVKVGDKVSSGSLLILVEAGAAADKQQHAETQPAVGTASLSSKHAENPENPVMTAKPEPVKSAPSTQPNVPMLTTPVLTGTVQSTSDVHAGPGVRRLARELGVNLTLVQGSGPKQRILQEDVQAFVKGQLAQLQNGAMPMGVVPTTPVIDFSKFGPIDVQALSRIKKISGKNLQRNAMMIPHVTQFGEADITFLEDFRQAQKSEMDKQKIKLTPLVFIMKAVVASLKVFPQVNASLDAQGENLIMKKYFHLGIAVDTPEGLVVPVIRDVDKKGLVDLAKELGQVSEKARNKQLTPGDMQGGCFSISSLGGIGGTAFTPIINAPEVAILGVSKASYQPVYQDGAFIPRLMLPLSLSYDHRVIDGAEGARFITHLSHMLSDIRSLLL
ncbi:MAG: dihydrolipoyllysine-residue acetyltransferase [Gammaproteobacteria bacterium]|nr:dihydrolipoyllysine-residue acetyltransferase [Gammaproteobacteria bacterium]MCW5582299.1 dihydrolipoyllysine-residue acetyltransferase [Gammaproteobacteria bacterium]